MDEISCDLKPVKKVFSRIGWALTVIMLVATVFQTLWFLGGENWFASSSWGMWIGTFLPIYAIAVPAGLLVLGRFHGEVPQQSKLGGKNFLVFIPIAFCLMYCGNIIGTLLSFLLSGGAAQNALTDYAMDTNPLKILVMVVLAPLIEEYIFRRQIIDRTWKYGEKTAVFLSALTFGLFHGNLFQFFYAFGLGWLFGYIYLRTGRLRYTVLLHGIVNFVGSVVAPLVLSLVDLDALMNMDVTMSDAELMAQFGDMLPGLVVYMLYAMLLMGLAITGLVLLILKCRKLIWKEADAQLPKGTCVKTVYLNAGMAVFILLHLSMIVYSLM